MHAHCYTDLCLRLDHLEQNTSDTCIFHATCILHILVYILHLIPDVSCTHRASIIHYIFKSMKKINSDIPFYPLVPFLHISIFLQFCCSWFSMHFFFLLNIAALKIYIEKKDIVYKMQMHIHYSPSYLTLKILH